MAAIPKDDTMSRDTWSRDRASHLRRGSLLRVFLPPTDLSLGPGGALGAQLRTLALLRAVSGCALLAALVVLGELLGVNLRISHLLAGLVTLAAASVWLVVRLHSPSPVSEREFFAHLMVDLLWLSHTTYWLGGSTHNPFADLFVVYIGMAAMVLNWRYVAATAFAALSAYAVLRGYHADLEIAHSRAEHESLEALAYLVKFVMLAAIVAFFVHRLAWTSRRHCEAEARAVEREARCESAVDLAALAAGTAHEMATPLTTIALLADELREAPLSDRERAARLETMSQAVTACKLSLSDMVAEMGAERLTKQHRTTPQVFVDQLVQRFATMRPGVRVSVTAECADSCVMNSSAPLRQAILSLIANAADASPDGVELHLRASAGEIRIDVLDRGPGIPGNVLAQLGRTLVTTKENLRGNGMGVYLANLTMTRLGGRLEFTPRDGGGTRARVTLPTSLHVNLHTRP